MLNSLYRTEFAPDHASGSWLVNGLLLYSIEQPWNNNLEGHSCVPAGLYELVPYMSPTHGPTWLLHNPALGIWGRENPPPGMRTYCEVHSANWARQLKGCIALGLDHKPMLDPLTGAPAPAIEGSRDAIKHLISVLGEMTEGHTLLIQQGPVP